MYRTAYLTLLFMIRSVDIFYPYVRPILSLKLHDFETRIDIVVASSLDNEGQHKVEPNNI